ncbi:TonB-dependent receptor [Mangrovibacterium marinum]|uniref:SusC/RagA family TonB-linked outer membrane protein n=1 Tax=Mangrovibacterium marinum TaxID=1639118 RepID=UPI002A18C25D|nr:TonB-dependent receptor [Mangrovibacterium marinum]
MIKLNFILVLLLSALSLAAQQQKTIAVAGSVMDTENGELLPGVSIYVKGSTQIGTTTNADGFFRIEGIPAKSTLVFSFIGYKTQEKEYGTSDKTREKIGLAADVDQLDEVVVTAMGTQRKVSVTGSIATIKPEELQVPAVSVSNMLQGRVPGIIGITRSGEPGNNFSEFWIRGISTFGANQSALVLVDGVEGDLNTLDPDDIESFSILKDASATAVYGVRGANGVVIVTTKRGKAGKLNINLKTNATYSYSPRMPKYTDAYNYALLSNEARVLRGEDPNYTQTELDLFRYNLDPDLYPNVNWRDVILKDHVMNYASHLSISGGGANARYYMSLGVQTNEALFKQDKSVDQLNTNVNYNRYNFRANIDVDLTKTTKVGLNIGTVVTSQNAPGEGKNNDDLWRAQANLPPTMVPVKYSNGQLPSFGTNSDEMSPYVRLNYTGSTATEKYSTRTNLSVKQDLSMITPGLSARGLFSLASNGLHSIGMYKTPALYYADPRAGRNPDGSLLTVRRVDQVDLRTSQGSASSREYYYEVATNYNHVFAEDHRVTGLVHFYRQESKNSDWAAEVLQVIPKRYQALSGRLTYAYRDTYLIEGNLGYTGSENFNKERRYGLFPSISLGWVPSQYAFFKDSRWVNYLKLRASYGEVGNDRLKVRFPYLTLVDNVGSGAWQNGGAISETTTGATNMQWETTHKYNLGIDANLFKDRIEAKIDFFRNKTTGIFQQRANIPGEVGMSDVLPYSNIGAMTAWGTDGTLSYSQQVTKDLFMTLRTNFTLARNRVDYWEETFNYPYQSKSGVPYNVKRGLVALGLFKDEADILSSPTQTYMADVRPGDIKYKDVNGDGQINDDDIVPLSYADVPNFQYGFALEASYKNFTVSAFFEGVSEIQFFYGGSGYYPFAWGSRGNVLDIVADPSNRWIPMDYAVSQGIDPALAENPNARFPRLTYGRNENNNRASTFWLANGDYLRLKNVQLAYNLPQRWIDRLNMRSATLSLIGDNLHVWDKVKLWDPAQASANGGVYPLQRMYTVQLNVTF